MTPQEKEQALSSVRTIENHLAGVKEAIDQGHDSLITFRALCLSMAAAALFAKRMGKKGPENDSGPGFGNPPAS